MFKGYQTGAVDYIYKPINPDVLRAKVGVLVELYRKTQLLHEQEQKLIAINNMPDHVHILLGLQPDMALSDLVGDIKAGSSAFIKRKRWVVGRFSWQEGFGAFSYSRSQFDTVIRYIQNQQKHHARKTFREEYIQLLEKFGIVYDKRYIFRAVDE